MKIETIAQVKSDGSLDLHLQTDLKDAKVRILVFIEPTFAQGNAKTPEGKGWPPGYFEELCGSLPDDSLVEPEELPFEERERLV